MLTDKIQKISAQIGMTLMTLAAVTGMLELPSHTDTRVVLPGLFDEREKILHRIMLAIVLFSVPIVEQQVNSSYAQLRIKIAFLGITLTLHSSVLYYHRKICG
jgi:hypothetical protein